MTVHAARQEPSRDAAAHWRNQRVTAAVLVPLTCWLIWSLAGLAHADYKAAVVWVAHPLHTVLLILFIGTAFQHARLGLEVMFEDYLSTSPKLLALIGVTKFLTYALPLAAAFAVLKIWLLGEP